MYTTLRWWQLGKGVSRCVILLSVWTVTIKKITKENVCIYLTLTLQCRFDRHSSMLLFVNYNCRRNVDDYDEEIRCVCSSASSGLQLLPWWQREWRAGRRGRWGGGPASSAAGCSALSSWGRWLPPAPPARPWWRGCRRPPPPWRCRGCNPWTLSSFLGLRWSVSKYHHRISEFFRVMGYQNLDQVARCWNLCRTQHRQHEKLQSCRFSCPWNTDHKLVRLVYCSTLAGRRH